MKYPIFSLFIFSLFVTSCSKKLDNIPFNDNPYDNDYTGAKAIRIDSIHNNNSTGQNIIYFTRLFTNNDGVRLYRNGVKKNTITNSVNFGINAISIGDNSPTSGTTYTYDVRLFLGSGEAASDPYSYTTP